MQAGIDRIRIDCGLQPNFNEVHLMFDGFCEIRRAGILPDGRAQIDIRAVDGRFDWRWAYTNAARGREVLAVALTAIATHRQVGCAISRPEVDPLMLDGWFGLHK